MSEKAFEFLPMPERSAKPRSAGLTMVIDTGLGYHYTEDLLEICADYIDLWKLGWATTQLQPRSVPSSARIPSCGRSLSSTSMRALCRTRPGSRAGIRVLAPVADL